MAKPKVVEPTRHFHHEIADGAPPDSWRILHHSAALDTTIDMFNAHPSARLCLIGRLLFGREGAPTRLFGRLPHLHPIQRKGEKAQILEQLAVGRQGIRRIVSNPFVMHRAFKGGTQKEDGQRGSDQQQVFQGVALFLAAIMERLFRRVRGARDGPLGAIMAKRGGVVSVASGWGEVGRLVSVGSGAVNAVPKRSASAA